jgi:hypothetical protein
MKNEIRKEYFEMLSSHLDPEVICYLRNDPKITELLIDYLVLLDALGARTLSGTPLYNRDTGRGIGTPKIGASEAFSDYSFLIAPIYKAFEGYLFLLAQSLGLKSKDQIITSIGSCYDEEKITNMKMEIMTETGNLIQKKDKEGLGKITELKRVLEQYRHNPAHFMGSTLDTFQKATDYGGAIFTAINETTNFFLQRGDIKVA